MAATSPSVVQLAGVGLRYGKTVALADIQLDLPAQRMVGLMPKLANVKVRRTWRGLYPMTPDGAPVLGWSPRLKGYAIAKSTCLYDQNKKMK